uniref:Uncharacterized protein n=1 Tax=Oryza brachyantha TaxID=4533 RepID=J3M4W9_ORYBR
MAWNHLKLDSVFPLTEYICSDRQWLHNIIRYGYSTFSASKEHNKILPWDGGSTFFHLKNNNTALSIFYYKSETRYKPKQKLVPSGFNVQG